MQSVRKVLAGVRLDRRGVTALEYGLIAAVMVAVVLAGFNTLGDHLSMELSNTASSLPADPAPTN